MVAGIIPVALGVGKGHDFRAALGITVIGGVITSTLLTCSSPRFCEILADSRDWLLAKVRARLLGRALPAPVAGDPVMRER